MNVINDSSYLFLCILMIVKNSQGLASDMPKFCEAVEFLKKYGVFCLCFIFLWFRFSFTGHYQKGLSIEEMLLFSFIILFCRLSVTVLYKNNPLQLTSYNKFFVMHHNVLKKCLVSWYELQNADMKFKQSSQSYWKGFHKRGTWDYCWRMLQPELPGYNRWSMILLYFVLIELQFQD